MYSLWSFIQLGLPVISRVGERQSSGLITAAPGVAQMYMLRISGGRWTETSPSFYFTDEKIGTYKKEMNLS